NTFKGELEALHQIQNHLTETNPSVFSPKPDLLHALDRFGDIGTLPLFIAHFLTIPHTIYQNNIDNDKAYRFLIKHHQQDLKNHFFELSVTHDGKAGEKEYHCFLYDDLIIYFG